MSIVLKSLASSRVLTRSMAQSSKVPLSITHDRKNREFYVEMGNEKALLKYEEVEPGLLDLTHTEVPPVFRGQGVAALLAQEAFDFVANNNLKTRVTCTYLTAYLQKDAGKPYLKFVST